MSGAARPCNWSAGNTVAPEISTPSSTRRVSAAPLGAPGMTASGITGAALTSGGFGCGFNSLSIAPGSTPEPCAMEIEGRKADTPAIAAARIGPAALAPVVIRSPPGCPAPSVARAATPNKLLPSSSYFRPALGANSRHSRNIAGLHLGPTSTRRPFASSAVLRGGILATGDDFATQSPGAGSGFELADTSAVTTLGRSSITKTHVDGSAHSLPSCFSLAEMILQWAFGGDAVRSPWMVRRRTSGCIPDGMDG